MSQYIDIGANLTSKQFSYIPPLLNDAQKNGVQRIILTGSNLKNSEKAINLTKKYPWYPLFATVGIHPHDAKSFTDNTTNDLKKLLADPKVVAVGECGLDYNRMFSPKEMQIKCFRTQLDLAIELGKPVFLHERDAVEDFYNILSEYKDKKIRGVVHCFTGNKETAQKYLDLGMFIGITGWICDDRRNKDLVDALTIIPLDKMMVETDSPFLSPIRGQTNVPSNIKYVVAKIAKELNKDENELANQLYNNTKSFFAM